MGNPNPNAPPPAGARVSSPGQAVSCTGGLHWYSAKAAVRRPDASRAALRPKPARARARATSASRLCAMAPAPTPPERSVCVGSSGFRRCASDWNWSACADARRASASCGRSSPSARRVHRAAPSQSDSDVAEGVPGPRSNRSTVKDAAADRSGNTRGRTEMDDATRQGSEQPWDQSEREGRRGEGEKGRRNASLHFPLQKNNRH